MDPETYLTPPDSPKPPKLSADQVSDLVLDILELISDVLSVIFLDR